MENNANILRQRMEDFGASPSDEIWGNIEKKISSGGKDIYNLEVAVPEVCWENISANLNNIGQKKSRTPLLNANQWIRYAAIVIGITTLTIFAINPNIRNAFINELSISNIKAALPEKPYQLHKTLLIKDSSVLKKNQSKPLENQIRTEK